MQVVQMVSGQCLPRPEGPGWGGWDVARVTEARLPVPGHPGSPQCWGDSRPLHLPRHRGQPAVGPHQVRADQAPGPLSLRQPGHQGRDPRTEAM